MMRKLFSYVFSVIIVVSYLFLLVQPLAARGGEKAFTAFSLQASFPDVASLGMTFPLSQKNSIRAHLFVSPPLTFGLKHKISKEEISDLGVLQFGISENIVNLDFTLGPNLSVDVSMPFWKTRVFLGLSYNRIKVKGDGIASLYTRDILGREKSAQTNAYPSIEANIDFLSTRIGAMWEKRLSDHILLTVATGIRIPLNYFNDIYKVNIGLKTEIEDELKDIKSSFPNNIAPKERKTRQDLKRDLKFITSALPFLNISLSYIL